ncbi:conidiospore surface [Paramyrothecium foliicola]|nr:conidiospore surface [Paramyrothecium foliicola]
MSFRSTCALASMAALTFASAVHGHAIDLRAGELLPRHETTTTATCPAFTETTTVTDTVTDTVTNTATVTATPSPPACPTPCPPPPSCNNLGFDWAYYNNSARNTDTTYSTFHPDTYKTVQPLHVGTTSYVGGIYGGNAATRTGPIYDSAINNFKLDFFAINHHAYLYACEAGRYRINIPYSNDAVFLWTGAKAYAGWTDENADARARYNQPDTIAGSASFSLTIPANTYVPIRFVYGQAQYGGGFSFTITTPSGEVIVSNEATFSPYVVRYSCDRTTAPVFPAFGRER